MSLEINVHHINEKGLEREFHVSPDQFPVIADFKKRGEYRFYNDISISFKADIIRDIIEIKGRFKTELKLGCSRCLDVFPMDLFSDFEFTFSQYRNDDLDGTDEEDYVRMADERGVRVFRGDIIQITEALQEEIVMSIPSRAFCKKTCKGICISCGKSLNKEKCTCDAPVTSPFAALKDMKLKE